MAHAPSCDGPVYGCPKCGLRGMTIEETFDHECKGGTMRTILIHLNVQVPESDTRTTEQIIESVNGMIAVGQEGAPEEVASLDISMTLAEEV